jgi:hypothetical protein
MERKYRKERAIHRFGMRLIQTQKNSSLCPDELRVYLKRLKEQFIAHTRE